MKQLKESSKWLKTKSVTGFTWQIGYGAFSVRSSKVETVIQYTSNQKQHPKTKTYKEELEDFNREYDIIEYDEKYFWS